VELTEQLEQSLARLGAAAPRAKAGVRTLLQTERKTRAAMNRDVADSIARSAGRLEGRPLSRATLLRSLKDDAASMADRLTATIHEHRQQARRAALRQLQSELHAAGVNTSTVHWPSALARAAEDMHHAESSAQSLASAWRGVASHDALKAERTEKSPAMAVARSGRIMGPRVERTATTEIAQAYASEHRYALLDAVEYDRNYRDGAFADAVSRLGQQWSAMAEACPVCAPHDGEIVGIGESFSDGAEPGFQHPRCRCISIIVRREAAAIEAA
jgi:hypothetical protein